MPEQFTTYWPTYEGLRVLQAEDLMQLSALLAQARQGKDIQRLVKISQLRIQIRERREKLIAFELLARDILSGQQNENSRFSYLKANDSDQPF